MEPVVGPEPDVPSAQLHCCHPTPEDHIRRVRRMSFMMSMMWRVSVGMGSNSGIQVQIEGACLPSDSACTSSPRQPMSSDSSHQAGEHVLEECGSEPAAPVVGCRHPDGARPRPAAGNGLPPLRTRTGVVSERELRPCTSRSRRQPRSLPLSVTTNTLVVPPRGSTGGRGGAASRSVRRAAGERREVVTVGERPRVGGSRCSLSERGGAYPISPAQARAGPVRGGR